MRGNVREALQAHGAVAVLHDRRVDGVLVLEQLRLGVAGLTRVLAVHGVVQHQAQTPDGGLPTLPVQGGVAALAHHKIKAGDRLRSRRTAGMYRDTLRMLPTAITVTCMLTSTAR